MATTEAQMQAIKEAEDIDSGVDTRTKEEMLAEQMADLKSIRKTIKEEGPMFIAESTPGVGEAIAAKRTSDAIDEGDYVGAAIEGTAGALGLVPIIGDAASKGLRKAAKAVRKGYNPEDPASRVFHLTKKDFDTADVIGSGTSDIGFHVGTAAQANARGSTNIKYDKDLAEQMVKDERILPMVLKENLKPARIPDVSSFKEPMRWIGNMSVAKSDRQRIELLLGDPADAYLLAKAPRVTVGGDTYSMLPDVMRMGMDEKLWKDLILQAHKAKRIGLDTINNQKDRVEWFNTLKQTANKHGYDSFVYKNEHEGTDEQSLDALVEQIQKASRGEIDPSTIDMNSRFADSYMLLEPDQAKGLFGGMTKGDPKYMKNKGGLMLQEGGVVPMKEQMELFEDGGLMDEGGTVDPVSGNDVPPGSTQEEVRDDIPAQLSEGEFVFPADVVRCWGLDTLMRMRQQAKMGLRMMEEMGQMGNSEEATIPDDIPFDINDLDMEDELEYNVGGFVPANQQQQEMGISGYQAAPMPTTSFATQPVQAASQQFVQPVSRPAQAYVPVQTMPTPLPTFGQITGPGVPEVDFEFATFRNEAGQEIQLRIKKGSRGELLPGEVLPEGYSWVDPTATKTEEVTTAPTTYQTTQVTKPEGDGDAERQRREEEMYGPGGGRLAILGDTYGVSFDMGDTFIPGVATAGATAFSLAMGKPVPESAKVTLQRGDEKYLLTGKEYNTLKTNLTNKDVVADVLRSGDFNIRKEAVDNRYEEALSRAETKEERDNIRAVKQEMYKQAEKGNINKDTGRIINPFEANRGTSPSQAPKKEGDGSGPSSSGTTKSSGADWSGSSSSSGTGSGTGYDRDTDRGGGGIGGGFDDFRAKGGLINKPKPKTKKMKRGGLASKK